MAEHWVWARDLLSVLVAFLYGQDDDGMDLYFTSSTRAAGTFSEPRNFFDTMSAPEYRPPGTIGPFDPQPPTASPPSLGPPGPLRVSTTSTSSTAETDQDTMRNDIRDTLSSILGRWSRKIGGHPSKDVKKKLTLIILTDGKWPGVGRKRTVAEQIITSLEKYLDNPNLKPQLITRGLTIQFVRFGNDKDAIKELDWMDNSLKNSQGQLLP